MISSCLIPDSSTLIESYAIPTIINNKDIQKLPENFVKLLNNWMAKYDDEKSLEKRNDNKQKFYMTNLSNLNSVVNEGDKNEKEEKS